MIRMPQRPAQKIIEDAGRVLITGLARIDRDQIMHHHHEFGAETALQSRNPMKVIALHPCRAEQAQDRWVAVVEQTGAVEVGGARQIPSRTSSVAPTGRCSSGKNRSLSRLTR
jgi:hypothetical protein